jgi:hypothetical protein
MEISREIQKIKGKTVAVVYTFEGDTSGGLEHFFIWKSNIISNWLNAIEELHCLPLIIDVRTFLDKAVNKTLPHIDYVLNMNTGTTDLSVMALIPATCSSLGIPCIPCNAVTIVTGENKLLSNLIAKSIGLQVPQTLNESDPSGIFRPVNLGNSLGVERGSNNKYKEGIYQEFIHGYELTTPLVYNVYTKKMDLMPSVLYLREDKDLSWFNSAESKKLRNEYKFRKISLDEKIQEKYLLLADTLSIHTFCRIDARVRCMDARYHDAGNNVINFNDLYFIEVNVMPTIRDKNNFMFSFDSVNSTDSIYSGTNILRKTLGGLNIYSFLLASSMISFKTMY